MSGLLELAERCEKAKARGGEAEKDMLALNGDIALAIGLFDPQGYKRGGPWARDRWFGNDAYGLAYQSPSFTASLDAAMTLVPEGWRFEVTTTGFKPGASIVSDKGTFVNAGAYAATPALALCAAALRARAASTPSNGDPK